MAKRRDYKAEYARTKARAKAAGYSGEREYRSVRRALALPPRSSPISRRVLSRSAPERLNAAASETADLARIRREARRWSETRSQLDSTKLPRGLTEKQIRAYHKAFVNNLSESKRLPKGERDANRRANAQARYDYFVPDFMEDDEWREKYGSAK